MDERRLRDKLCSREGDRETDRHRQTDRQTDREIKILDVAKVEPDKSFVL